MRHPLFLLISYLTLNLVISDFQFCYKGPHRLLETDCPGGFVANEKLATSCVYYARTPGVPTSKLSVFPDVCDPNMAYEVDVLQKNEDAFADYGKDIQHILFEFDDQPLPDGDEGGKPKVEEDPSCFSTCLAEWIDPSIVEDESPIDDKSAYSPSIEEQEVMRDMYQDLFTYLQDGDEEDDDDQAALKKKPYDDPFTTSIDPSYGEGPRILKLLGLSMRIVLKECSPFVPEDFLRQIHRAMSWYAKKNESVITDVTALEYNYYVGVLHRCYQRRNLDFLLTPKGCSPDAVEGIQYVQKETYWKYRQTAKSYRNGKHSPYVEAAWNVVEFIHGYCFESFLWDMMDLHSFTTAMEGLFTDVVMRQWLTVISLKNPVFNDAVLQVTDTDMVMRNLDACVIGGNSMAPWTKRLERPYVLEAGSSSTDIDEKFRTEPTLPGWNGTEKAYWKWYEAQGGFPGVSKSFGVCIQNASKIEAVDALGGALNDVRGKQCGPMGPQA